MKKNFKRYLLLCLLPLLILCAIPADAQEEVALPIAMYHHISKRSSAWNDYVVSLEEFRADMDYLAVQGYTPIRVSELLAWTEGNFTMPEKPCMITFDDGFESTLAYAEPILEEHGFCAVVAVIGSVCDEFSALDEHDAELSNLSWEDAAALAQRGTIEVQCHTWNMHGLGSRSGCNKKRGEDTGSYRYTLTSDWAQFMSTAAAHGLTVQSAIAYPYGAFCRDTTAAARDFGFRAAFTCTEEVNHLTGAPEELFTLGRFNRPHGISSEKYFSKWKEKS